MFKNIKKLKKLIENYDKIMLLIEKNNNKTSGKSYSTLNTPQSQLKAIEKIVEGGKQYD